jgi:hypothetical protein
VTRIDRIVRIEIPEYPQAVVEGFFVTARQVVSTIRPLKERIARHCDPFRLK